MQYISLVVNGDGSLYARNVTTLTVTVSSTGDQFSGPYTIDQIIGTVTKTLSTGTVSGQLIPRNPLP